MRPSSFVFTTQQLERLIVNVVRGVGLFLLVGAVVAFVAAWWGASS